MAPRRSASPDRQDDLQDRREQARAAKLAELHDRLADQVRSLASGEDWKRWLATAARFPTYSFANQLLIAAQRPDATAVAGYRAWQALGRQVGKGEKGIAILAPVIRRPGTNPDEQPEKPPGEAAPPTAGEGEPRAGRRVVGFRPTYVWDVAQTTGRPLPEPPHPRLLAGQAPDGLWDALAALAADRGLPVARGDTTPANGYTDFTTMQVVVRPDVDDAQAVKTLAHELGHVLLHDPRQERRGSEQGEPRRTENRAHGRPEQEVEAESVAYLVAAAHGLDTDDYTFAYVAGWAAGRNPADPEQVVRDTAHRVLSAAGTVLAATQPDRAQAVDAELAAHVATSTTATHELRERAESTRAALDPQQPTTPVAAAAVSAAASAAAVSDVPARGAGAAQTTGRGSDPAVLREIHAHAQAFYREQLARALTDPASPAALAVAARGLPTDVLDGYGVGYAPNGWSALTDHLRQLGYDDGQLLDSGLGLATRRGTVVDRFRHRLLFPVHDVPTRTPVTPGGRVIAYLGRSLDPAAGQDGGPPKYLNSPDTVLYRKGQQLYGLGAPLVSAALDRGAIPVLVEGPWDALAVTAADGHRHVGIAAGGTALTPGHVTQLDTRVPLAVRGLVTAFDDDPAGARAALAAYPLLRRVADPLLYAPGLPGLDPSALYAQYGPDVLRESLAAAADRPLANRVTDALLHPWDLTTAEGRVGAARALAAELATLPPEQAARQIARATTLHGLPPENLHEAYPAALDTAPAFAPIPAGCRETGTGGDPGEEHRRGREQQSAPTADRPPGLLPDRSPVALAGTAFPAAPTRGPITALPSPAAPPPPGRAVVAASAGRA